MQGFRIGRIFGVDIRVDVSWVFIAVLMTWNLVSVFARWHPEWTAAEGLAVAVAATLLFFGCVLLHELAHSVVAMRFGVPVRSITLFLFGGVSNIEHEPPSPGAEFLTAIVGPLTSVALGIAFLGAAALVMQGRFGGEDPWTAAAGLGPAATLLAWLGPINVFVGLFNLIPGFPLDGGRVLRSIVWRVTGDLRASTRGVARFGQAIGWALVAVGVAMALGTRVPLFGTGLAGGLWMAFIGWFLGSAARQATLRLDIDEALAGHSVSDWMRRDDPLVRPDTPLAVVVQEHFMRTDDRALPVVENGRLVGLVTARDVGRVPAEAWSTTPVDRVMRGVDMLVTTTPDRPALDAWERLVRDDIEQMPVLANGAFVGTIRRSDVARWLELVRRAGRGGRGVPPTGDGAAPPAMARYARAPDSR